MPLLPPLSDPHDDPVLGCAFFGLVVCLVGVVILTLWYAWLQGWL